MISAQRTSLLFPPFSKGGQGGFLSRAPTHSGRELAPYLPDGQKKRRPEGRRIVAERWSYTPGSSTSRRISPFSP
jgi:hypothetical protein